MIKRKERIGEAVKEEKNWGNSCAYVFIGKVNGKYVTHNFAVKYEKLAAGLSFIHLKNGFHPRKKCI
jgi:hypothetical protein